MKLKHQLFNFGLLLVGLLSFNVSSAQVCSGAMFSDDFNNSALWTVMGTQFLTGGGAPGSLTITGGQVEYLNFRGGQTYRLVRPVTIPNQNLFRAEFEVLIQTQGAEVGASLLAITSKDDHSRTATSGSGVSTDNNVIDVLLGNPLGTTGNYVIKLGSKYGTTRAASSADIPVSSNRQYYIRVERLTPTMTVLSIFDDAARTNHIPLSPVCYEIDPRINDLGFLQQSVWPSSSQNRTFTGVVDNLCLFNTVLDETCLEGAECEVSAKLGITKLSNCKVIVGDQSTYGAGTTPMGNAVINFGDGSTGQYALGSGFIKHTYDQAGTYTICITVYGYGPDGSCCSDTDCITIDVECDKSLPTSSTIPPAGSDEVKIFPNPATSYLQIQSGKAIDEVRVYDLSGKIISRVQGIEATQYQLPVEELGSGVYLIEVVSGGMISNEKFVKK